MQIIFTILSKLYDLCFCNGDKIFKEQQKTQNSIFGKKKILLWYFFLGRENNKYFIIIH